MGLILHYAVNKGPKYDTKFAISSIMQIKKYKPHYVLAYKAYDSELIKKCITEESKVFDKILLKKTCQRINMGNFPL